MKSALIIIRVSRQDKRALERRARRDRRSLSEYMLIKALEDKKV